MGAAPRTGGGGSKVRGASLPGERRAPIHRRWGDSGDGESIFFPAATVSGVDFDVCFG